jgi:hypothetical protein
MYICIYVSMFICLYVNMIIFLKFSIFFKSKFITKSIYKLINILKDNYVKQVKF